MITKLIVPVAGRGTRFLPATKSISKEMLPVLNRPLIHYICEEAYLSGIKDIIFVINREKTDLLNYFKKDKALEDLLISDGKQGLYDELVKSNFDKLNISYVEQKEPLGLGHAIGCAKMLIHDEPFAVSLPDELFLKTPGLRSLVKSYTEGYLFSLKEVDYSVTSKYGIIDYANFADGLYTIKDLVEKPRNNPPSNLAITGRYILDPSLFKSLDKEIVGVGDEIQLTDAIKDSMMSSRIQSFGKLVESIRFDCGSPAGWLEANNWVFEHCNYFCG